MHKIFSHFWHIIIGFCSLRYLHIWSIIFPKFIRYTVSPGTVLNAIWFLDRHFFKWIGSQDKNNFLPDYKINLVLSIQYMRELFFGLLLWKLYQFIRLLRKHNQIRISHWSTVSSVHAIGAFGTILRIRAAWKNLEYKALSSLHKLLRNWLWEEEERRYCTPSPTNTLLLDGSVTIYAQTTVHCSPYPPCPAGSEQF